jgi:neutral ceramidase
MIVKLIVHPFALVLVLSSLIVAAEDFRVGAAAEVITPAPGTPMSGSIVPRSVQAVDDDLHAKAIVIEQGDTKVAMVVCDLITMPRPVVDEARELISKTSGISPDRVMISATHTHTGPLMYAKAGDDADSIAITERVNAYVKALPALIAKAVQKADAGLVPARASVGIGTESRLSYNRRYFMKTGPLAWNPGKLNPNTDRPAGPTDTDVPVVLFETISGKIGDSPKPIATHVSFALHPDTLHGEKISADFPAHLSRILAQVKGPDMLTFYATGACGDVNHVNVNFRGNQIGAKETQKIGTVLAGEVLKAYARSQKVAAGPIAVGNKVVQLPLPPATPADIEAAEEELKNPAPPKIHMPRLHALRVLDTASRKGKPLDAELQVFTLGQDLAFVALPGELFAELGLAIKAKSPFKHTILITLANGSLGYLPTRRAYEEGNYEPTIARCAAGSGEQLVASAIQLLNELKSPTKPQQ